MKIKTKITIIILLAILAIISGGKAVAAPAVNPELAGSDQSTSQAIANSYYGPHINLPGLYVSANVGLGGLGEHIVGYHTNNGGLAYGVDMGVNFNRFFAIEAGIMGMPEVASHYTTISQNNFYAQLALKGSVLFGEQASIYGKAGAAYVYSQVQCPGLDYYGNCTGPSSIQRRIRPYFAIGGAYAFTDHVSANLELAGTWQAGHRISGGVPSMMALTAGITYQF